MGSLDTGHRERPGDAEASLALLACSIGPFFRGSGRRAPLLTDTSTDTLLASYPASPDGVALARLGYAGGGASWEVTSGAAGARWPVGE